MKTDSFTEDLPHAAALGFHTANHLCGQCQDYHSTWTFRRILGAVGGIDADRPQLMPLLQFIGSQLDVSRWLIAGTADSGILAMLAASLCAPRAATVMAVDRCRTPLVVCADYAHQHGLHLQVQTSDIIRFESVEPFDAVLVHSLLGCLSIDEQKIVLARLRDLLRPNGHFVVCSRFGDARSQEIVEERVERNVAALRAAVLAGRVVLPEPLAQLEERLVRDARTGLLRDNLPATPAAAVELLRSAGFRIENVHLSELAHDNLVWASERARQRVVIHARV